MKTQLDIFSVQIVSKYFNKANDYLNIIQVCSKFKNLLDRFRYNPIPISSMKLFPCIQTQYLYSENDQIFLPKRSVVCYEIALYKIRYFSEPLLRPPKHVVFTKSDSSEFFSETIADVPEIVSVYGPSGFSRNLVSGDVDIPNRITKIEEAAFSGNSAIHAVNVPSTIFDIPPSVFYGCYNLRSVRLSESVTSIGACAFENCRFDKFDMPKGVKYIGNVAFYGCSVLSEITISDAVKVINRNTFAYCNSLTRVILPLNLVAIKMNAFHNCVNLSTIKIPQKVIFIESEAFLYCSNLREIEIPKRCLVQHSAFKQCFNLTQLNVPNINGFLLNKINKEEIKIYKELYTEFECKKDVFLEEKVHTTNLNINPTNNTKIIQNMNLMVNCLKNNVSLSKIVLQNVKKLGENCFENCFHLSEISGLKDVIKIGNECFKNCEKLSAIELSPTASVGVNCFCNCTSLKTLEIPNIDKVVYFKVSNYDCDVLERFGYTFKLIRLIFDDLVDIHKYESKQFETVEFEWIGKYNNIQFPSHFVIPKNVTKIGSFFFSGNNVQSIKMCGVKEIGDFCFSNCIALTNIEFPSSLTKIGDSVFFNSLTNLKNFAFPNPANVNIKTFDGFVNEIQAEKLSELHVVCPKVNFGENLFCDEEQKLYGNVTFKQKQQTELLEVKSGFQIIGRQCCYYWEYLQSVVLPFGIKEIQNSSFKNCYSLSHIDLPNTLTKIGKLAFKDNFSLQQIELPISVISVGKKAFYNCRTLSKIVSTKIVFKKKKVFAKCVSLVDFQFVKSDDFPSKFLCQKYRKTFKMNFEMKHVEIPEEVEFITNCSFTGMCSLMDIKLDNVISLGDFAFSNCISLSKIEFVRNAKLEHIGAFCFFNCTNLLDINKIDYSKVKFIGKFAFKNCFKIEREVLKNLTHNAFENIFGDSQNTQTIKYYKEEENLFEEVIEDSGNLWSGDIISKRVHFKKII
ncbi:hypothetical protein EIN_453340 [Entamoeba invadens IP1]|uniref:Leucine rich repeat containing protein BspA family protein n=1 Tax=Entamoeba invadens IP1 TaxID=370355 RepID=L7FM27_ENTIV|nr:hypothetical protein EIN_453340 [Entamoeba invadens IP1]ELP89694.1 hypothetical protein EIN_453340 [Entamoeba invadens IP1]|eukprot:XP_004256465.1 hypothetical protein EIN_453340 [Entamoeba invadens IP1]